MARDFNGGTDRIDTGLSGQTTQRTIALRFTRRSAGGGSFGRLLFPGASTVEYLLFRTGPITGIYYSRLWSGVEFQWHIGGTDALNTLYSVVVSYDSSSAANNAIAWVNGASATITNPSPRTGTPNTTAENYVIGNNSAGNRGWDGAISEVGVWSEMVPNEIGLAVSGGYSPSFWRRNLTYYNPLIRDAVDLVGGRTQTVTGTTITDHPRVLRTHAT